MMIYYLINILYVLIAWFVNSKIINKYEISSLKSGWARASLHIFTASCFLVVGFFLFNVPLAVPISSGKVADLERCKEIWWGFPLVAFMFFSIIYTLSGIYRDFKNHIS